MFLPPESLVEQHSHSTQSYGVPTAIAYTRIGRQRRVRAQPEKRLGFARWRRAKSKPSCQKYVYIFDRV